jgi:hypothetical protein
VSNAYASAFPITPPVDCGDVPSGFYKPEPGLTKREIFAALAMQGLLSKSGYMERNSVATDAVTLADNLLAALEKAP